MYRGAVCPGKIARLCCGAEQILCPQVVLRRRGRFRCSLCGKWMGRRGARYERGTGQITHMVDRQPCAWRDLQGCAAAQRRILGLVPCGPRALPRRYRCGRWSGVCRQTGECRTRRPVCAEARMRGCVATQVRCRAHRPRGIPERSLCGQWSGVVADR